MERKWKWVAAVLAIAVVVKFALLLSIHLTVKELENRANSTESTMSHYASDLQNQMYQFSNEVETLLNRQASLLADSEVTADYQDGKLLAKVSVTPKTLDVGERVFVTVNGTRAEAMSVDGLSYEALISVELREQLNVAIQFEGSAGKRQEMLEPVQTGEMLAFCISSGTGEGCFWMQLVPNEVNGAALYTEKKQMELEVQKDGVVIGTLELEPAEKLPPPDQPPYMAWNEWTYSEEGENWYADLSPYLEESDWTEYQLFLSLETVGGLQYYEYVGDFSADGNFGGGFSTWMYPVSK